MTERQTHDSLGNIPDRSETAIDLIAGANFVLAAKIGTIGWGLMEVLSALLSCRFPGLGWARVSDVNNRKEHNALPC